MERKPKKIPTAAEMLRRLASLCARSEQCEADIAQKIYRSGLSREEGNEILSKLREGRFIDDSRFARAFASDKARFAGWGRLKIRQGLAARRIPSAIVAEALENIDEEEYMATLRRCALAKARSLDMGSREDRMKLYRHLVSRGYESALAAETVRGITMSDER